MFGSTTRTRKPRIVMYSQDGFGLGHMRRTSSIARELLRLRPDASVLTMADSRLGQFFETSSNHDYVKLPSIVKQGPGEWRPVSLGCDFDEVLALRKTMIQSAVASFQPDILLVDHMPHGAMGELLPALELLRRTNAPTRVVLGLRDILDAPAVVQRRWQLEGAYEAIEHYYDTVLVYGKQEIFDLASEYAFPAPVAGRMRYCGYVCTPATARYAARVRAQNLSGTAPDTKLVVAMAGGGADAYPMMRALLDALPLMLEQQRVVLVVIAGPFMPADQRHDLEARARGLPARVRLSVSDSLSYIEAADLVVGMAGYNTTTEILRSGKPAVLIPRSGPSAEQSMRAQLFSQRGWVDMLDPHRLDPATVAAGLIRRLDDGTRSHALAPDVSGLSVAAAELAAALPQPTVATATRQQRRATLVPAAS